MGNLLCLFVSRCAGLQNKQPLSELSFSHFFIQFQKLYRTNQLMSWSTCFSSVLKMNAVPCQEPIGPSPYYSYHSKLAKENTMPSKTCPWLSGNLEKSSQKTNTRIFTAVVAHNSKNLGTAQVLIVELVYSFNRILHEPQLTKSIEENLRNSIK